MAEFAGVARYVLLVGLASCGRVDSRGSAVDGGIDTSSTEDAGATCAPTPAGLAGRWRGEMTMKDDLGRYNGSTTGNAVYVAGRHGSAFAFNGTDTVITIADAEALWPTGSFSVEAWVSASPSTSPSRVITKYDCGVNCPGGAGVTYPNWSLDLTTTGLANFTVRSASGVDVTVTDPQHVITDGNWHHLVGVRDIGAKQAILYVDGAAAASATLSGHQLDPLSNTDGEVDPVTVGASRKANVTDHIDYLRGAIDEIAYYSAAISAQEIQAIYAARDGECR